MNACETGLGQLNLGEGLISIGRGFIYAGAANVMMSLWPIDDKRSTEITNDYYKFLSNKTTKDESLRHAKLNFIKNYSHISHPYYWAPFITYGNIESVLIKKPVSLYIISFLIIAFIAVSLLILKRIIRNK